MNLSFPFFHFFKTQVIHSTKTFLWSFCDPRDMSTLFYRHCRSSAHCRFSMFPDYTYLVWKPLHCEFHAYGSLCHTSKAQITDSQSKLQMFTLFSSCNIGAQTWWLHTGSVNFCKILWQINYLNFGKTQSPLYLSPLT